MKAIKTTNHSEMNAAIAAGNVYHVEFGNAEAEPMPGVAYLVKTIEEARAIYRKYAIGYDLALVKIWTAGSVYGSDKVLFQGFVA